MFDELYQEILMDHYRHPRNAADLSHIPDSRIHENPTCGDAIKIEITSVNEMVTSIQHETYGCAISTASASLMSEYLKGKNVFQVQEEIIKFLKIMRGELPTDNLDTFEDLVCLAGVAKLPVRLKCATLAWHALLDCILHLVSGVTLP
ncbi:MAG: SUF system NifU family Fe-S cluster assembly protein [Spirochaetales bacterium]|nr:SUF system NifU family Fe-S cluster assembly protein [Spirochaetales bacterium]